MARMEPSPLYLINLKLVKGGDDVFGGHGDGEGDEAGTVRLDHLEEGVAEVPDLCYPQH